MKLRKFAVLPILMLLLVGIYSVSANVKSTGKGASGKKEGFDLGDYITKQFRNTNEYFLEIVVGIVLITYGINYYFGKKANEKFAEKWVQANIGAFRREFPDVGVANTETGSLLEQEGANYFKFYASGRRNCPYARVIIELKNRQNLLSMLISVFWTEKDRIRVEIPISIAQSLPFLFAIVKRKDAKFVQQNYPDIKAFCQTMTYDELRNRYIVLGESEESSEYILSDRVVAILKKHHDIIEMISFTDLQAPHKQLLRADMVVPSSTLKDPKDFHEILETLFYLVDRVAQYKMSPTVRTKAEKERQLYQRNNEKNEKKTSEKKEVSSKKKDEKKEEPRRKLHKKLGEKLE